MEPLESTIRDLSPLTQWKILQRLRDEAGYARREIENDLKEYWEDRKEGPAKKEMKKWRDSAEKLETECIRLLRSLNNTQQKD